MTVMAWASAVLFGYTYISMLRIVHIKIPAAMGAWPWVQVSSDSPEMSTQQCRA